MHRVLVVDDDEANLSLYAAVVKRVIGEDPLAFQNPLAALDSIGEAPPSLIIVDNHMPEMDGVAFVSAVRSIPDFTQTPILMLTSDSDSNLRSRAMAAGVSLVLEKPVPLREFTAQLRYFTGIPASKSTYGEVIMPTDERDTLLRLHRVIQMHNKDLALHARSVRDLAIALANELHLLPEQIEGLRMGALVYDIGMLSVPDKVLSLPSELPPRWRSIVNGHVDAGASVLGGGQRPLMRAAETIARFHHERYDGSGYPDGLVGDEIPILARIVGIADSYVALVSERPHRPEFTMATAAAQIVSERGTGFDPTIVDVFERIREHLPQIRRSA
jgi:response regulator RpfG family c-di-GMP phosphodiesterase